MKKPTKGEIEDRMLENLNDFMKDFGIDEITFGKTHRIKKTGDKKAEDIILKPKKYMKTLDEKTKQIAREYAKFCMVQLLTTEFGYRPIHNTEMKIIDKILDNIDQVDVNKILKP